MRRPLKETSSVLPGLCFLAAFYGIGFGLWMLPTALFVGPHILIAALAHIGFGTAFLLAGRGMRDHKRWGFATATICGGGASVAGLVASAQSIAQQDLASLIFWSPFAVYFLCVAAIAVWHWRFRESSVAAEFGEPPLRG